MVCQCRVKPSLSAEQLPPQPSTSCPSAATTTTSSTGAALPLDQTWIYSHSCSWTQYWNLSNKINYNIALMMLIFNFPLSFQVGTLDCSVFTCLCLVVVRNLSAFKWWKQMLNLRQILRMWILITPRESVKWQFSPQPWNHTVLSVLGTTLCGKSGVTVCVKSL